MWILFVSAWLVQYGCLLIIDSSMYIPIPVISPSDCVTPAPDILLYVIHNHCDSKINKLTFDLNDA